MEITAIEELMYKVMRAIYESGIPIDFKGSMVLKACLMEAGYLEETRHTVDIDANWRSDTPPTADQMVESLQKAIDRLGLDLDVILYRMYKEHQSAGFDIIARNTGEKLFSMDIDVNRWPAAKTKVYEVNGLRFRGVAPTNMFVDKILFNNGSKRGKSSKREAAEVERYFDSMSSETTPYAPPTDPLKNQRVYLS